MVSEVKHIHEISHHDFTITGYIAFEKYVELQYRNMVFWMPLAEFVHIVFQDWRKQ